MCPETKETISTHEFGSGLKYMEQFYTGQLLYDAIMVLKTDISSMGLGGGDFGMTGTYKSFEALIKPNLGRWHGKNVEFVGDYSSALNDMEQQNDITQSVATTVYAMVMVDFFDFYEADVEDACEYLLEHLKITASHVLWHHKDSVKRVICAIESHMGETREEFKVRMIQNHHRILLKSYFRSLKLHALLERRAKKQKN